MKQETALSRKMNQISTYPASKSLRRPSARRLLTSFSLSSSSLLLVSRSRHHGHAYCDGLAEMLLLTTGLLVAIVFYSFPPARVFWAALVYLLLDPGDQCQSFAIISLRFAAAHGHRLRLSCILRPLRCCFLRCYWGAADSVCERSGHNFWARLISSPALSRSNGNQ